MIDQCLVLADTTGALAKLCGISVLERLLRTLQRCGFRTAIVLARNGDAIQEEIARPSRPRDQIAVTVREKEHGPVMIKEIVDLWPKGEELLLVLRGDTVFDDRLLRLLATQTRSAVLVDRAPPPDLQKLVGSAPEMAGARFCGAAVLNYDWAEGQAGTFEESLHTGLAKQHFAEVDVATQPLYSPAIRRDLRPFWFAAPAPSEKILAERLLLRSIQKGAPDFPAWVHAPIENFFIARLCKTSITPNQLTIFCNVVAWMTTILFFTGRLYWGVALALIVGVLDGLDGKQARIKVETSKGGKLEHWFDALFEWSWWTALAYHFQISGQLPGAFRYWLLLLAAETLDGLAKGGVFLTTGKVIDELGPFERFVRLLGGRRNVYVWILTIGLLWGEPAKAFIVMAWWEAITAAVHLPLAARAVYRFRKQAHVRATI